MPSAFHKRASFPQTLQPFPGKRKHCEVACPWRTKQPTKNPLQAIVAGFVFGRDTMRLYFG